MFRTRVHSRTVGKPTRDDVAKIANTSGATVSRVLSGRSDLSISPDTRAKVLEAAEQLGYRPNVAARALMTGQTGLIGLWMSLHYSRYRGQVLGELRSLFADTELALAVTDVDEEYTRAQSFERALRVPVDGIIAFDNSASVDAFGREHDKIAPNTPFVSMGAYWSEQQSFVGVDLYAGAVAAMDHLLDTGRRKIAYVAPAGSDLVNSGPRFEAYRDRMLESGLAAQTIAVEHVTFASIREAIGDSLKRGERPDALFCMYDDIAIAASYGLPALGVSVGSDIAIVGFDGIEETEHCPVPITTVKQPIEEMCRLSLQYLQAQFDDPLAAKRQILLTPELIVRQSSLS